MKRALLIATALSAAGGTVCAQPANGGPTGMESCFQSARGADSVCSNPANDAVQRLDCLLKARTTLLECLEHVSQDMSTAGVSSDKPSAVASPDMPTAAVSSDKPAAAASPEAPTAGVSADKP